jgi:hypothetical protein
MQWGNLKRKAMEYVAFKDLREVVRMLNREESG